MSTPTPNVSPFKIVVLKEGASLILSMGTGYRDSIFATRAEEGFEGGGYDWQSLAAVFLAEKCPQLLDKIGFDSESSMFCAYSKDREALETFALAFHALCENEAEMIAQFSRAEFDG